MTSVKHACYNHLMANNFKEIAIKLGDRIDTLWTFGNGKKAMTRELSGTVVEVLSQSVFIHEIPFTSYVVKCDKSDVKGYRSGYHKLRLVFLDDERVFSVNDLAIVSWWKGNNVSDEERLVKLDKETAELKELWPKLIRKRARLILAINNNQSEDDEDDDDDDDDDE